MKIEGSSGGGGGLLKVEKRNPSQGESGSRKNAEVVVCLLASTSKMA